MGINTKSIIFKAAIVYVFVTLLNVTVFNVMVWENQTGLIMDNAILSSQHTGSSLKYRIDNAIGPQGEFTPSVISKITTGASELGVGSITVFSENGAVFIAIKEGVKVERQDADPNELRMINMAITRQGFEDKLFFHKVNKKLRTISLYIPFSYAGDKIAVASLELEMRDISRQMGYLYRQCLLIGLLIVAIHLAFAFFFSKMLLIPLRNIIDATQKISAGDLNIRVPIVGQDELGILASSFNEMSVALNRMRDEAKGSNPLTGLPGNITIARYIDECLNQNKSICVLYCDLDNFKAYNDKYGFSKGDDAILYTRDCLITVAKRNDVHDVFVAHEGGDDFVVITPFDCWENYAKAFITTFDRGIYQFYNSLDARNGFIESVNRQGQRQRFPLMSISIAAVTNATRRFTRHAEMIQVAAEVKKYVKGIDGSCYALDRRTGTVSKANPQPGAPMPPKGTPVGAPQQAMPQQQVPQQGQPQQGARPGVPQQAQPQMVQQPARPQPQQAPVPQQQHYAQGPSPLPPQQQQPPYTGGNRMTGGQG